LCDLFRRSSSDVLTENTANDHRFRRIDLPFTGRRRCAIYRPHDSIAVGETATGFALFHAAPHTPACLVRQILQEQRVHCSFQANMQVCDLALGERHDAYAEKGQTLEEAGGVCLVTAE